MRRIIAGYVKVIEWINEKANHGMICLLEGLKRLFHLPSHYFSRVLQFFEKNKQRPEGLLLLILYTVVVAVIISYFEPKTNFQTMEPPQKNDKQASTQAPIDNNTPSPKEETSSQTSHNPWQTYGQLDVNNINFVDLKKVNSDVVAFLRVNATNINYPVVQTTNNQYYLDHSITKKISTAGWVFSDYRNQMNNLGKNTIFYGHDMLNRTAFGTIKEMFSEQYAQGGDYLITTVTEQYQYRWQVFSLYISSPEAYYLKTDFSLAGEFAEFVQTITKRSMYQFGVAVGEQDHILTLSTCNEENNRRVVHAKLIEVVKK